MQRLGLCLGSKKTVLFDCETGEILSEDRTEVMQYLKDKDGFYTLQVF